MVAGHGFGTFVDPTLLFGILFDFWTIFDQHGPKFRRCVLGRLGGLGVAGHGFDTFSNPPLRFGIRFDSWAFSY